MRLDDLKISTKVMIPAIVLALVALASVAMGTWQASRIEKSQELLVERRAPTELAVARFSRQVATIGYSAYRDVANDGASQNAHQASDALEKPSTRAMAIWTRPWRPIPRPPPNSRI